MHPPAFFFLFQRSFHQPRRMAEAMLIGVIRNIIANLGSQSFQDIGSFFGVEDELHKIGNTVSRIDAVLEVAVERQNEGYLFKVWLKELKDVVYEVDDLFGELSAEALQRRVMAEEEEPIEKKVRLFNFFSSSNSRAFRSEMGHKIREIRKKLNAIASDDGNNFCLTEYPIVSRNVFSRMRRLTTSYVPKEMVIGREDDKRAIIELLLAPDVIENVSFISIEGVGGLGKTTLAQYQ